MFALLFCFLISSGYCGRGRGGWRGGPMRHIHRNGVTVINVAKANATGYNMTFEDRDDNETLTCFDVDIIDFERGDIIGVGKDCFMILDDDDVSGSLLTDSTHIFNTRKGQIVAQNRVSVHPIFEDEFGSDKWTHVVGAYPEENNVISTAGYYAYSNGKVRLNGNVDMSRFEEENIITFDYIFVFDLEMDWEKDYWRDIRD